MKTISLIVPVFNTEPYLEKCLRSLTEQTYRNIEIIAVNDGSTDGSARILEQFAAADPRIRIISTENRGLSAARNTGICAASGDWLMFVDSDDFADAEYCAHALANVLKNNAEIGIVSYRKILPDGTVSGPAIPIENAVLTKNEILERLSRGGLEHYMWNKIFRKDLFAQIRFPDGELWEDIAILHLLLDRADRVVLSDEPLYNYVRHPGTIMGSHKLRSFKWPYLQYKKQYAFFKEKYPMYAGSQHTVLAITGLRYAFQLAARGDPFPLLWTERQFLREIPAAETFSAKEKAAYRLLTKCPRIFYRVVRILFHRKACEDE